MWIAIHLATPQCSISPSWTLFPGPSSKPGIMQPTIGEYQHPHTRPRLPETGLLSESLDGCQFGRRKIPIDYMSFLRNSTSNQTYIHQNVVAALPRLQRSWDFGSSHLSEAQLKGAWGKEKYPGSLDHFLAPKSALGFLVFCDFIVPLSVSCTISHPEQILMIITQ